MKTLSVWLVTRPAVALVWSVAHLPRRLREGLGDLLGILWFDVFRIRRKLTLANLKRAFPDWTEEERVRVARKSLCHMGRNLTEYAILPFLRPDKDRSRFVIRGLNHLDQAKTRGKGVCLLTLHLGNGDFAVGGLAIAGVPLTLISKEFKSAWLNRMWFGVRRRMGTKFIPPRNSSYGILKALKAGETVVFVMDQFMGPPIGVRTQFFGHETGTALGLALMAERSQAPVVPVYTFRRADGVTEIIFEPEIPFEMIGDRDQSLVHMTQTYNDCLEKFIRLHPEQWMWVHNRWKAFREPTKVKR